MFLVLHPSPLLAPYVQGYWFVEDLEGAYAGTSISTTPHPGAVLSVNFGRPNAMEGGPIVPRVSLSKRTSAVVGDSSETLLTLLETMVVGE